MIRAQPRSRSRTTALAIFALCTLASFARAEDAAVIDAGNTVDAATPLAAAARPAAGASIDVGERHLCAVRVPRAGQSPEDRARHASRVLAQAIEDGRADDVRVAYEGGAAVVYLGAAPVIQLDDDDAHAAGDATVSVHAEACADAIRQGLRIERTRRNIANQVFSISLIVLSGLLAFLLLGAVSRAAARLSALFEAREVPALKIGTIELLTPAAVRVTVSTAISVAKPIAQIVIVLGWLLSALSLFSATQAIGRRLTGYVLVPLTTFLARIGSALPLFVLVTIGGFTVFVLLRFLRVFFDSVAHGGIHLGWLPPDRALPVSVLARAIVIIGTLLAVAPLLTGDGAEWGALRVVGVLMTLGVVLALVPATTNFAVGTLALLAGKLRPDTFVEIGAHTGRLTAVTLVDLEITERSGAVVRVPHLLTLFRPLRVLGESLPSRYEIVVDARAPQGPIRKAIADALRRQGRAAHVELVEIKGDIAIYLADGTAAPGEEDLTSAIADALTRDGVAFARIRKLDVA